MLVSTRKVGDAIQIGEDVIVYVTQIKGNRVMLGLKAPKALRILRRELSPEIATIPLGGPSNIAG
jgi:carbon storage regulator